MNGEKMPRILVVEERKGQREPILRRLQMRGAEAIGTSTIKEALKIFESRTWDAIVIDACMFGNKPSVYDLVRLMRQTFQGPIIAHSLDTSQFKFLREIGCDYECYKKKADVIELLEKLLSISIPRQKKEIKNADHS